MSWFSSSSTSNKQSTSSTSSSPSSSPSSSDYKPLDRTERQACWEARDGYFSCLDKHNILDAIKDADAAKKSCGPENEVYERDCAKSWIHYFKQKRVAEWEKEQKIKKLEAEGAVPASSVTQKPAWKVW